MQVFGYQKDNEELLRLEEMTLQCNIDELDKIIDFLVNVKKEHSSVIEKAEMCHSHLRDWDSTWKIDQPDFIVVTKVN